jgi:hypothetical protein
MVFYYPPRILANKLPMKCALWIMQAMKLESIRGTMCIGRIMFISAMLHGLIMGHPPVTHGAAGWQMNLSALEQIDAWDMQYASDGRSTPNLVPYRITFGNTKSKHVQYPTTLPTFDELIGIDGADAFGAAQHILTITQSNPNDQVFTLHAELEGQKLLPAFRELIVGWLKQGHDLVTMGELHCSWAATGQLDKIATEKFKYGTIANRSGELMIQASTATNF